jgi:WD40 repeat protein
LEGHRSWVTYLKFLPNGNLASASADQTIRLWDVAARKPLRTLRGHRSEVHSLDVSRDGRTLASGSKDGTVLLWDLAAMTARTPGWSTVDSKYQPGSIHAFAFSPDSRMIATAGEDAASIYDAGTLRPIGVPDFGFKKPAARLLFSPDSRLLVATDADGHLGVWDVPRERQITNFAAHAAQAGFLGSTFLPGGKSFLTYGMDNTFKEWDATIWREIGRWPLRENATTYPNVYSATSANGLLAIKLGSDDVMQIFPASDPLKRRQLTCPVRMVGVAISPDESTIAGACEDGALVLWDTRTLVRTGVLRNVLLGLHSVAFSPDGQRIVAGSNGKEAIKIWDFASHQDLATLEGKGSLFRNACFSPDGNMIAARNWNGMLHVWRAPSLQDINATEQVRRDAQ